MRLILSVVLLASAVGCNSISSASRTYAPAAVAKSTVAYDLAESSGAPQGIVSDAFPPPGDIPASLPMTRPPTLLSPAAKPQRLLVYSGRFALAVGNILKAADSARDMAEELGGYFQSLKADTITLRVPADRWEDAVGRIGAIGRVLSREIEAADVTEEVTDLRLSLKNARALGDRLEQLLAKAETVEAALKVETELARVRTEIEKLEGRLQYLADRIAYSTLTLRFVKAEDAAVRPAALPFPWLSALSLENLIGLSGGAR